MNIRTGMLALAIAVAAPGGAAFADDGEPGKWPGQQTPVKASSKDNPLGELYSGYYFATAQTRAMQDDDFENPSMLLVEKAKAAWSKVDGEAGKSCQSCHNDPAVSMKGVTARYPVYYEPWKKPINVDLRINECREKNMKAKPWKYDSGDLVAMTALIGLQSRGMPVSFKADGAMAPFVEKGKEFYYQRRGQLDLACANCHENYYGAKIRSELLSQGQINGFPLYRLKPTKVISVHNRFKGCNENIRAKPYEVGSDEYVNLESYLRWRGNGLTVEAPGVRK